MNIWEQSFEDLRRPHLEEKKGDGNLANNYPPYGKVTRGDVIAGATGKDQMGGKKDGGGYDKGYKAMQKEIEKLDSGKKPATAKRYKEMKNEHSSWRSDFKILDEEGCESDNSIKPKRGIKNKITINPELKTEQITTGPVMKPGSGLGGGKLVYPKGQEPKTTGAKLPTLQQAHYEPEGEEISEREMTSSDMQKEKNLKKKYDPSGMKSSMKKQYGTEKGEEVYFATIRKKAMEQYLGLVEKKHDTYLELDMEKRQKNNEKAIADMKKTKANKDMVKAASKHFEEHQRNLELDYYLDEALRPASERMQSMQTAAGRKKQEQQREKKSKLEAEADKILAGFSKKGTGTAKTKAAPKAAAPEANRYLKTGQKKDTLAMKVKTAMSERREMDEPGEEDWRPEVKRHNKMVGYKPKPKRPSIENDPRYGSVKDK